MGAVKLDPVDPRLECQHGGPHERVDELFDLVAAHPVRDLAAARRDRPSERPQRYEVRARVGSELGAEVHELHEHRGAVGVERDLHRPQLAPQVVGLVRIVARGLTGGVDLYRLEDDQPGSARRPPLLVADVAVGRFAGTVEGQECPVGGGHDAVAHLHRADGDRLEQLHPAGSATAPAPSRSLTARIGLERVSRQLRVGERGDVPQDHVPQPGVLVGADLVGDLLGGAVQRPLAHDPGGDMRDDPLRLRPRDLCRDEAVESCAALERRGRAVARVRLGGEVDRREQDPDQRLVAEPARASPRPAR